MNHLTRITCLFLVLVSQNACSQDDAIPQAPPGYTLTPFPDAPMVYETGEGMDIRVEVIAPGLAHPFGFTQLPDGTMLVTERDDGRLRVIRNDVLDPEPVSGLPEIAQAFISGLNDVLPHPDFAGNRLLYLSYLKPLGPGRTGIGVYRGEWNGSAIVNGEDIFVAEGLGGSSRLQFDRDNMLYVSFYGGGEDAQDLGVLTGKIIRLTDAGEVPQDNPFVNRDDARPEIWTWGHRTPQGFALHPETGALWSMEMGPNGGDEVNILERGANYGWPIVSLGRAYAGSWAGRLQQEGLVDPVVYWMPSISVSGMVFYTGDKLPAWRGDLFVGGLRMGEIPGTGQIQRIRMNTQGEEIRREVLLADLRWRMRGVYQGVDGYLYTLVDEDNGAVLRIGAAD